MFGKMTTGEVKADLRSGARRIELRRKGAGRVELLGAQFGEWALLVEHAPRGIHFPNHRELATAIVLVLPLHGNCVLELWPP